MPAEKLQKQLADKLEKYGIGENRIERSDGVFPALTSLSGTKGPVLVVGSLYLLAEFYTRYSELLVRK